MMATGPRRWYSGAVPAVLGVFCILELVALALWPALNLVDSALEPSPFGEMMRRQFAWIAALLPVLKSVVDWLFPGALWSWEALITFFFHLMLVAFAAYAFLAWRLSRGGRGERNPVRLGWIIGPLILLQITLVFTPATLTTDIYNYALYGEMPVIYGANPFISVPSQFPQSALYYLIPVWWHDAPSAYGPSWVALSTVVAQVFHSQPLVHELLAYRTIANAAHLGNTVLIWAIAQRLRPGSGAGAAVAYGWNPAALLEFCLNGHNDALMLTPMLAAILLTTAGRHWWLGAVLIGTSVAQKYTSVLVAPLLILWAVCQQGSKVAGGSFVREVLGHRRSLVSLALSGGIVVAAVAAFYAPFLSGGWDTFRQVAYWVTGPRMQNFWPEPYLIAITAWIAGPLQLDWNAVWDGVLAVFKVVARLALVGIIGWEVWRARRPDDVLAGGTRIWLVFLLLVNTWIMPWYYLWPLALAAPLGWSAPLVRVTAGMTLTAMLVMYGRQLNFAPVGDWVGLTLVLPIILAAVGIWLRSRGAAPT